MKNFDFGGIVDNNPRENIDDDREESYQELIKDGEEILADPLEAGHLAADEIIAERSIDKMETVERVKE